MDPWLASTLQHTLQHKDQLLKDIQDKVKNMPDPGPLPGVLPTFSAQSNHLLETLGVKEETQRSMQHMLASGQVKSTFEALVADLIGGMNALTSGGAPPSIVTDAVNSVAHLNSAKDLPE